MVVVTTSLALRHQQPIDRWRRKPVGVPQMLDERAEDQAITHLLAAHEREVHPRDATRRSGRRREHLVGQTLADEAGSTSPPPQACRSTATARSPTGRPGSSPPCAHGPDATGSCRPTTTCSPRTRRSEPTHQTARPALRYREVLRRVHGDIARGLGVDGERRRRRRIRRGVRRMAGVRRRPRRAPRPASSTPSSSSSRTSTGRCSSTTPGLGSVSSSTP